MRADRKTLIAMMMMALLAWPGSVRSDDEAGAVPTAEVADATVGSVSCGAANRGSLSGAVEMPQSGRGFEIPDPWWSRGFRYGTSELVGMLMRAAAVVAAEHPGGVLGIADISNPGGGALRGHRSHQSGRDADLHFYTLDVAGQPYRPDQHMPYFTYKGRAYYAKAPHWAPSIPERFFDLARNWAFIKALLHDPYAQLERVFISSRIRRWLLDYAKSIGEPEDLIRRAAIAMRPDSNSHNDHMHVRVSCPPDDVTLGRCRDNIVPPQGQHRYYTRVRCPARTATIALPAAQ